jgi:hypothetical protein
MNSTSAKPSLGFWAAALFILIVCKPLGAYKVNKLPFPVADFKVQTAALDTTKYDPKLSTYHDFKFRDSCAIENYEAQWIMNGKKQNLKFGFPYFMYDMYEQHADWHIMYLPQYKGVVLPEIFSYRIMLLLLPRPIEKVELYLHNRRVLASNLLLAPDLWEYRVHYPSGGPIPERKFPTPKLSSIYNSNKAYPQYKLQDIRLEECFSLQTAFVQYCPCEYMPRERKLYIYDLRIVIHYKDELIPITDIRDLTFRFKAGLARFDTHMMNYEDDLTFLWKIRSGRDERDILISEYGIPAEVVYEKIPLQD